MNSEHESCCMTQTDFWTSFPEIGLAHTLEIEISKKYWMSFTKIGVCNTPEKWNFGKNSGWVFLENFSKICQWGYTNIILWPTSLLRFQMIFALCVFCVTITSMPSKFPISDPMRNQFLQAYLPMARRSFNGAIWAGEPSVLYRSELKKAIHFNFQIQTQIMTQTICTICSMSR